MGLHVGSKVGAVGEALLAHVASVGLVARVGSHVTLQKPGAGKGLAADTALVVQVVGEDVHRKGRHGHVHLATDVALLGVVRIQAPVGLLVPGQVGAGGIVLATLRARVLGLVPRGLPVGPFLGPAVGDCQSRLLLLALLR